MKSIRLTLLLLALLSLPALACDFVTGTTTTATPFPANTAPATPVATPVAAPAVENTATPEAALTPELTVNFISHEDEREGIQVEYPESWFLDDTFFLVISDSPDAVAGLDQVTDNSVVILFAGPVDELPGTDPEEVALLFIDDYDLADDMEILEGPTSGQIQGEDAATVVVRGTSEQGTRFIAMITIIIGRERGAVIVATTPETRATSDRPILEAIANSVRLFTPTLVEEELDVQFIIFDETVTGTVTFDGSARWRFYGQEDEAVTIVVEPGEAFDVVLDLQDETRESVLPTGPVDQSFGTERITNFRLSYSGDYFIVLRGFAGSAGDYTLSLSHGGIIGLDLPGSTLSITATLSADGEHIYPFDAEARSLIEVIVEPEGGLDVVVEVYRDLAGDDDELLLTVDHSFGTEELAFEVPEDGAYYVLVRGFAGEAGTYQVTIAGGPEVLFELAAGAMVYGYIGEDGFLDYVINGRAGETLTINVESDEELDAVVQIVDLEGEVQAEVDDGIFGEPEVLGYTFAADALYLLRVRSSKGTPGSFMMTID
jgi:hypothetical protein